MTEGTDQDLIDIDNDTTLNAVEKARKRQLIINARVLKSFEEPPGAEEEECMPEEDHLKCCMCLSLCTQPVTAPCQHNYCLKCLQKWHCQGKTACPSCRAELPRAFRTTPRINTMLTYRIREAKKPKSQTSLVSARQLAEAERPDQAFTSERAQRKGMSNASSGRIFVTCHEHHFGPIGPEHDPERGLGVRVGEMWCGRLHTRQWGAHRPHVAGIAGGYEDDRDEGEWFLYTGSGGRDLSGNKRTNKIQSSDQTFESYNKALQTSCERGLPVRVVRSSKDKRSPFAPEVPTEGTLPNLRYDGVYRIVACWRAQGQQELLVCRYLFRRCDNEPAPWSSEVTGDKEWCDEDLSPEATAEVERCETEVTHPCDKPAWAFDAAKEEWGWTCEPPAPGPSSQRKAGQTAKDALTKEARAAERSLGKFACGSCKAVMEEPVCTPCGHSFCKGCLVNKFVALSDAATSSARSFRTRKHPKPCPRCSTNLADFMNTLQTNQAVAEEIVHYRSKLAEAQDKLKEELARGECAATQETAEPATQETDEPATQENAPQEQAQPENSRPLGAGGKQQEAPNPVAGGHAAEVCNAE